MQNVQVSAPSYPQREKFDLGRNSKLYTASLKISIPETN